MKVGWASVMGQVRREVVELVVEWALAENGWGGDAFYRALEGVEWMIAKAEWWPVVELH
jgi:hypothetical protein